MDPNRAMDPGLIYDLTSNDYLKFLCALGYNETQISMLSGSHYTCPKANISLANFNYPSITVPMLNGSTTVTRTVKNVGSPATYSVHVQNPVGISVSVSPEKLMFRKVGQQKSFKVSMKIEEGNNRSDYVFGRLTWSDGKHYVSSPIVVKAV